MQLVVTGHSLGAGTASVLAFLLRRLYPDTVCYAYSPPGCVFNAGRNTPVSLAVMLGIVELALRAFSRLTLLILTYYSS